MYREGLCEQARSETKGGSGGARIHSAPPLRRVTLRWRLKRPERIPAGYQSTVTLYAPTKEKLAPFVAEIEVASE